MMSIFYYITKLTPKKHKLTAYPLIYPHYRDTQWSEWKAKSDQFCTLLKTFIMVMVKVLRVPSGFELLFSPFLQDSLDEDVHRVDMLPELGHIQISFGILSRCFTQKSSYLFCAFSLFLDFRHQLSSFNLILMQVFERLLGPSFLKCLKTLWCVGGFAPHF